MVKDALPSRSTNVRKQNFEIRDHNDLVSKVIPHFEQFPLLSKKQKEIINSLIEKMI